VLQLLVLEDRTALSVLTVLNTADSGVGSLRDTIATAQSGDTIVFDPSLAYETISANKLAISGNNASQLIRLRGDLFRLSGNAQISLDNLTLTGGMASEGGAIFIGGTAALTLDNAGNQAVGGADDANPNALGGAVYNSAGASQAHPRSGMVTFPVPLTAVTL
jgi:hypothetical protein